MQVSAICIERIPKLAKNTNKIVRGRRPPLYIPVGQLFLDPENPRLPEEAQGKSESELMEVLIKNFNLEELADSMAENGYFDEEPLVGIPQKIPKKLQNAKPTNTDYTKFIKDENTKFTVVEGNRRVATARLLLDQELRKKFNIRNWLELDEGMAENLSSLPIILYSKRSEVIPYLGVRHIIGIQKWDSYARASYVANMVKSGRSLSDIQQQIGDRRRSARKIYFCRRLIEEIENEFDLNTEKAKNYFSYLVLSIGQGPIREFLGIPRNWSEVDYEQPVPKDKLENLKYLFSWLFGEGKGKLPVIKESRDITNKITPILRNEDAIKHLKLTGDLDDAYERSDGEKELLLKNLKKANKSLGRSLALISLYKIDEVKEEVERCSETLKAIFKLLED